MSEFKEFKVGEYVRRPIIGDRIADGTNAIPDTRQWVLDQIVGTIVGDRGEEFLLKGTGMVRWDDSWFEEVDQLEAFVQYTRNNLCAGS